MIFRELTHFPHEYQSGQKDVQMFPPVPMVYEHVPAEPLNWEYHVLRIDLREYTVPTVDDLNALGGEGWLLVGTLQTEQRYAHYYFVRQKRA